jgi:hypothetical protein
MEGGPSVQQFFGPMCGSASGPSLLCNSEAKSLAIKEDALG